MGSPPTQQNYRLEDDEALAEARNRIAVIGLAAHIFYPGIKIWKERQDIHSFACQGPILRLRLHLHNRIANCHPLVNR